MKKTDSFQRSTPETVTISRAEYEELQAQSKRVSELESRVDVLMEALRLAQRKRFGASSEKSEDTLSEQLSFLFNEAEVFAEEQDKEDVTVVAAHKRHKKHEYTLDKIPEDVPVEQIEHRLEGQELVCPQCGEELTEIGKEVVNKLKIIPARVVVEQHIYCSYACQRCNKENIKAPVVRAQREQFSARQLCYARGSYPYHDTEICHGHSHLPSGTRAESPWYSVKPPDHV